MHLSLNELSPESRDFSKKYVDFRVVFPPQPVRPIIKLLDFPANEAAKKCKECCICAVRYY